MTKFDEWRTEYDETKLIQEQIDHVLISISAMQTSMAHQTLGYSETLQKVLDGKYRSLEMKTRQMHETFAELSKDDQARAVEHKLGNE